jgi:hypothetical protein
MECMQQGRMVPWHRATPRQPLLRCSACGRVPHVTTASVLLCMLPCRQVKSILMHNMLTWGVTPVHPVHPAGCPVPDATCTGGEG